MKVIYKDFTLESDPQAAYRHLFTLKEKFTADKAVVSNGKKTTKGEQIEKERILGYGMSLSSALKKIVKIEIAKKNDVLSLKEYMRNLKDEYKYLKKIIEL